MNQKCFLMFQPSGSGVQVVLMNNEEVNLNPQESSSRDHDNLRCKICCSSGCYCSLFFATIIHFNVKRLGQHHLWTFGLILWGPRHFLERPSASTLSFTKKKKKIRSTHKRIRKIPVASTTQHYPSMLWVHTEGKCVLILVGIEGQVKVIGLHGPPSSLNSPEMTTYWLASYLHCYG